MGYGVAAVLATGVMLLGLEPDKPRFGSHSSLIPLDRTWAEILGWLGFDPKPRVPQSAVALCYTRGYMSDIDAKS